MKHIKLRERFLPLILSFILILSYFCISVGVQEEPLINETFNRYATNSTPDTLKLSSRKAARVVDDGTNDKALLFRADDSSNQINFPGLKKVHRYP